MKRLFDILVSCIGIILFLPFLLLLSILIKLESRGQILFKQERVGQHARRFMLYKLRSMYTDKRIEKEFDFSKDEERITKIGSFIRRTKLDEVPQLFNVLKGDMSIVGPRPTIQNQVDQYVGNQFKRLTMKPGLTGLAQINGNRLLTWDERIEYDLRYMEEYSFFLDMKIISKTILVILLGEQKFLRTGQKKKQNKINLMFLGATKTSYSALEALINAEIPIKVCASLRKVGNAPTDSERKGNLKDLAHANGIPYYEVDSNNDIIHLLQNYQPDAIFAISWPKIIRKDVLQYTPIGCVGFHPTPLPLRRGGAPLNWLLIDGKTESKLTLFKMREGIDDGPILHQKTFTMDKDDYIDDVLQNISEPVKELVVEAYQKLLLNRNCFIEQDEGLATYTWRRTPEDGFIQWDDSSHRIYNFIRGISRPFPGAFSYLEGEKLTIWRAEEVTGLKLKAKEKSGKILSLVHDELIIATRDYCLKITEFEYKKSLYSKENKDEIATFVQSHNGKCLEGKG
ncbi:sugar transferase [Salirhabdus euzebyi]|nr:sugar transferase [Salirhabdus euzebyi]